MSNMIIRGYSRGVSRTGDLDDIPGAQVIIESIFQTRRLFLWEGPTRGEVLGIDRNGGNLAHTIKLISLCFPHDLSALE